MEHLQEVEEEFCEIDFGELNPIMSITMINLAGSSDGSPESCDEFKHNYLK